MTIDEARQILSKTDDYFSHENGDKTACVDGHFTADELEAMAVIVRACADAEDEQ